MKKILSVMLVLALLLCTAGAFAEEALSPTTGLTTDKEYHPFLTQADNTYGARPQIGIGSADVVYEMEIDNGGYTRYSMLFNDNYPELAESVRSARIMHADVTTDWNATLIHWGGQDMKGTNVFNYFEKYNISHINGISTGGSYFYRDKKREAPHNVVCRLSMVAADFSTETEVKSPLKFSADNYTTGDTQISDLEITYRNDFVPGYSYSEQDGLYYRFYNREAYTDGATGKQVTCANVIIMYAEYEYYQGESDRPLVKLYGTNKCTYFIDGTCFEGYWTRGSIDESTVYYTADGEEVLFKPGVTFIQVLRSDKEVVMY